ncbi:MAG: hypothetical protein V6Z82_03855 [Flavobacteriales bacterium]
MNRLTYLERLYAALQYDTLVSRIYTCDARWAIHGEIARVIHMHETAVSPRIVLPKGIPQRRRCRINSDRQTEVYDVENTCWKPVHLLEKVMR